MSFDVAKAIADMRKAAPEKARTVALMRKLAGELDRYAYKAKVQLAARHAVNSGAVMAIPGLVSMNPLAAVQALLQLDYTREVDKELRDLTDARLRAQGYIAALEGLPDDSMDLPIEVRPLFYNVLASEQEGLTGAPFQSPDYLAPLYALNQYDAFKDDVRSFWSDMLRFVKESTKELGYNLVNFGPYILGAGALVAAAIFLRPSK